MRGLLLGAPLAVLLQAFLDAEGRDFSDQGEWKRAVEGELEGAGGGVIFGQFFFEGAQGGGRREEADVVFEPGEHDENPVIGIGWHAPLESQARVLRPVRMRFYDYDEQ